MKKILPHVIAVLVFLILTFAYLYPSLQGKIIYGSDTQSFIGMSKEAADYNATHDDQALWTNSMFGGMPTYQICMDQPDTLVKYIDTVLRVLPGPTYRVFLYLICFYVMLLLFGVNPYLSIVGAVAFAFGSYNLIIIVAGHNTKAVAIAYMAPIIASVYHGLRKNPWVGSALLALFLGLGLYANHIQIIYYTLFAVICFGVSELVFAIKDKKAADLFKRVGILCIGALVAVGLNATRLMTTSEYVTATMRGESNGLTAEESDTGQGGLDRDYITAWSYGVGETFTLMIPNFMGGQSIGRLGEDSHVAQEFASRTGLRPLGRELTDSEKARIDRRLATDPENFAPRNLSELMYSYRLPLYWGDQPFTAGPVYAGAIVCFLFILGLMIVPQRQRWWLLAVALLGTLLSWGKNMMWLTDLFIDIVPLYNKFRTVSMTLTLTCFAFCAMAGLALKELFSDGVSKQVKLRSIYIAAGVTGGLCMLFAIFPSIAGDFTSLSDGSFSGSYAFVADALREDRADMLRSDALRSLCFILLFAALAFVYVKGYLKNATVTVLIMGVLVAGDMVGIATRYLSADDFVKSSDLTSERKPSPADAQILADKSLDYRVLDLTVDIFNSSEPSYFHKNIGGYSAVKLSRYQELIEHRLSPEIQRFTSSLSGVATESQIDSLLGTCSIMNMLNTKYIKYHPYADPLLNRSASGSAWLVDKVRFAADADEEMALLETADLKREAVFDRSFAESLPDSVFNASGADIELISYEPGHLTYRVNAPERQLAVFSEIFYYKGWKAVCDKGDGEELDILRCNYLLRAAVLPEGSYDLRFDFEPKSYTAGNVLEIIASVILTLAFAFIIFAEFKKSRAATK